MKLPLPLPFGKKEKQKYILALLLRDEKISALITEEIEGKMRIVGQHEEVLTTALEALTPEEWLDTLDRIISKAEETLPPNRETHDTVFGVKETWVEEKKIKKEYLLKLKKISEALALTPIGFLVISEAMSHLIQAEEGAPVSAILVDIGLHSITATLVKGGKVLESKAVPRGESLPHSVDTALKHLTSVDVFPSRLILFSGNIPVGETEKNDTLAQQFITHTWSKSLPFLHAPQISVLNAGFDAKAVVQGAASQMGFEVLNIPRGTADDIKNYDGKETAVKHKTTEDANPVEDADTVPVKKEATPHDEKSEELPHEDFGFVMNEDVTEHPPKGDNFTTPEQPEPVKTEHHESVTDEKPHHESAPIVHHAPEEHTEDRNDEEEEDTTEKKKNPLSVLTGLFASIPLSRLKSGLLVKNLQFSSLMSGPGKKFLMLPIGIILLMGVLYYLYASNLKAEVTIYLKPNNVSETTDILFSTESDSNFSENIVAANTISADLDGTVSTDTTGKKDIGEKAKGTVTIYNNDDSRRQLQSGTTITTEKGLKFVLDKEVTVASASGDIFSGTKPGTAQVTVTAQEIGSDYNMPSGTKFNVSGGTDIAARNESAFSGGSKKAVTVVSKKDQDKLLAELSKSLQKNALSELEKQTKAEQKLLPFLTQGAVTKRSFDRKVDDEAKKLTLKGTVSYEALVYNQKDLEDFAKVALKNKYNDDLNLSEKGVSFTVRNEKQTDAGEVSAQIMIEAGLVPKIDTELLSERIGGHSVTSAQEELRRIPQVARAEIKLSPNIPFLPVSLPKNNERIVIKTAIDE